MSEKLSDCCGVYIYSDTDICSSCKEHCEPYTEEEEETTDESTRSAQIS